MALSNKRQTEKLLDAQRLIRGGVSRRKLHTILQEKYGEGIGKSTHVRLFRERVQDITTQEEARLIGFKAPRKRGQKNYNRLIKAHFLPSEARILTKGLTSLKYHEIPIMLTQRNDLYKRFVRRAAEQGYTGSQRRAAWEKTVYNWYTKNALRWQKSLERWQKKKGYRADPRRSLSDLLWSWFGHIKDILPPDLQSETPKRRKRTKQKPVTAAKITRSQQINNMLTMQRKATTQREKNQIGEWLKELRGGTA